VSFSTLSRNLFGPIQKTWKPLFERGDGILKIVPARCQRPRKDRISGVERVGHPHAFLFGGDVAIEDPDDAIEIADQCAEASGSEANCLLNYSGRETHL
jgi:hypothetical protein